jgi:hypothetical protein
MGDIGLLWDYVTVRATVIDPDISPSSRVDWVVFEANDDSLYGSAWRRSTPRIEEARGGAPGFFVR